MDNGLLLIGILIINAGISFWNAKVCGQCWAEARAIGGFIRVLVWCGAIQSAIGFSMLILAGILFFGSAYIPPEVLELTAKMWYLTIIIPALGSGLIITIHSWVVAFRERSLATMGTAAWNTFAQAHNTYSAVSGLGDIFSSVADAISDSDNKPVALALALAALALASGAIITACIIKHYAGTVPLPERKMEWPATAPGYRVGK